MGLPLPIAHRSASSVAGFLGMSDAHECLVGFKWLWWLLTSTYTYNSCGVDYNVSKVASQMSGQLNSLSDMHQSQSGNNTFTH